MTAYITPACPFCGRASTLQLAPEQIAALNGGALVQDVLPRVQPAARELLISGTHPDCWTANLGADD